MVLIAGQEMAPQHFSSTWDEDWRKNSEAFKAGLI